MYYVVNHDQVAVKYGSLQILNYIISLAHPSGFGASRVKGQHWNSPPGDSTLEESLYTNPTPIDANPSQDSNEVDANKSGLMV